MSQLAYIIPVGEHEAGARPSNPIAQPPEHIYPLPPLPPGIDNTLPVPPSGTLPSYPIFIPGHDLPVSPGHPDAGLPPSPGRPDQGLPPTFGNRPDAGLPPDAGKPPAPGRPDAGLPISPGHIYPPLNPGDGVAGKGLLLVWIVGTDKYRWVVVDLPNIWAPPAAQPK